MLSRSATMAPEGRHHGTAVAASADEQPRKSLPAGWQATGTLTRSATTTAYRTRGGLGGDDTPLSPGRLWGSGSIAQIEPGTGAVESSLAGLTVNSSQRWRPKRPSEMGME